MGDLDTKVLAQILKSKGRKGDTMLAHINPQEAALLKKRGGAGTENPETGLPEFFVINDDYAYGSDYAKASPSIKSSFSYDDVDFAPTTGQSFSFPSVNNFDSNYFTPVNNSTSEYSAPTPRTISPQYSLSSGDNIGLNYGSTVGLKPQGYSQLSAPQAPIPLPSAGSEFTRGILPGNYGITPPPQLANITRPGAPGAEGAPGAPKDDAFFNKEFMQKLGLAGLSAIPGIYQTRKAQEQARKGKAEQNAIADPYRKEGQALLDKARSGELNAVGQQQLQQMEARLRQGMESRGGVGNAQVQAQIEAFRQQLLQNQYDLGLKVSGIGDQIAIGAIKTGMEADRYVGELTGNYYNNMFRILSGASNQPTPPRA